MVAVHFICQRAFQDCNTWSTNGPEEIQNDSAEGERGRTCTLRRQHDDRRDVDSGRRDTASCDRTCGNKCKSPAAQHDALSGGM